MGESGGGGLADLKLAPAPSGDTTGGADLASLAALVNSLHTGGALGYPSGDPVEIVLRAGDYYINGALPNLGPGVSLKAPRHSTIVHCVGGTVGVPFIKQMDPNFNLALGGDPQGFMGEISGFVVDGTSAAAGAVMVQMGDGCAPKLDLRFQNITGVASTLATGTGTATLQILKRQDTGCGLTSGSATVTDASCLAGDLGAPVYFISGTGAIPTGLVVASVNPGVSFTIGTPSIALLFQNAIAWWQYGDIRASFFNVAQSVVFDGSTGTSPSFFYGDYTFRFDLVENQNAITWRNGANTSGGNWDVAGTFITHSTVNNGIALKMDLGAVNYCQFATWQLALECDGSLPNLGPFQSYFGIGSSFQAVGRMQFAQTAGKAVWQGAFAGLNALSDASSTAFSFSGWVNNWFNAFMPSGVASVQRGLAVQAVSGLTLSGSQIQLFNTQANCFTATLVAGTAYTVVLETVASNFGAGVSYELDLILKQPGSGAAATIAAWFSGINWAEGYPPVLAAANGAVTWIKLRTSDGGTTWQGHAPVSSVSAKSSTQPLQVGGTNMALVSLLTATNAAWPVPAGATLLRVTCVGGGGSGGGGGSSSGSATQVGGAAGTAGAWSQQVVPVGANTTLAVTVGAGGAQVNGGAAGGNPGTTGNPGTDTTVTGTGISVTGKGGGGGHPGAANSTTQVFAVLFGSSGPGSSATSVGAGCGGSATSTQGQGGGDPFGHTGGGGGGGGAANATNGGAGGFAGSATAGGSARGAGASGTAAGGDGADAAANTGGGGGGGGAGSWNGGTSGAGGKGGAGGSGYIVIEVVG